MFSHPHYLYAHHPKFRMFQEPEEDIKPKLNLNISYERQNVTVKVKPDMKFAKIFEAAEKRFNKESGTFKFVFEGTRVGKEDTPASLGMEDGDQVDAFLMQVGGSAYQPLSLNSRPHPSP